MSNPSDVAAAEAVLAAANRPKPTLATPSPVKGLNAAEQLRDALANDPDAKMNNGRLEYGREYPEMDQIATDDANFKRFMDDSRKPKPIRMRRTKGTK